MVEKRAPQIRDLDGAEGWKERAALVDKFNSRIDVIMAACLRALSEILRTTGNANDVVPELLTRWSEGKEALGRLRAFVSAGGPNAAKIINTSLEMRQRLGEVIEYKEDKIARVLSLGGHGLGGQHTLGTEAALGHMLGEVTAWEFALMGFFSKRTPLTLIHKLLGEEHLSLIHSYGDHRSGV